MPIGMMKTKLRISMSEALNQEVNRIVKIEEENRVLVKALEEITRKINLDYHGGKVLKADFEDIMPIIKEVLAKVSK